MQKPDESLDEYIVKPEPELAKVPPSPVSLRFTGEVEVLRPLARWEHPVKLVAASDETFLSAAPPYRMSWFHRSLAVGGGLAMAVLVLASAMFIGISDPSEAPDLARVGSNADPSDFPVYQPIYQRQMASEDTLASDIFDIPNGDLATSRSVRRSAFRTGRSAVRSSARRHATNAPIRLQHAPHADIVISQFAPTTLVIYVENGAVKSRIEPWLVAGNNRSISFTN